MASSLRVQRFILLGVAVLAAGCAPATASHVVRYRTASGAEWTYHPRSRVRPVELTEQQFREKVDSLARDLPRWGHPLEDAQRFFEVSPRSGDYLYEVRTHRLIPERDDSPLDEVSIQKWVADYQAWCTTTIYGTGDCLGILIHGKLTPHGRYVLALHMARGEVFKAAVEAARQTGRPKEVLGMLVCATGTYLLLWALPEPTSKAIAAGITVVLLGYLGFDTVIDLGTAFDQMVIESDQARDIHELEAAGQRFGKVFGQNSARVLISLAMAAIGQAGGGLAGKISSLPGITQAMRLALEEGGFDLAAVGEMETVAVSSGTVSISLSSGSVAMAAVGGGSPSRWTPPREGPGEWVEVNESMSEFSRVYQSQVTGAPPGWAYRYNGVDFDGYEKGVFIEAKGRYAQFLENGRAKPFFRGFDDTNMLRQARQQMQAARGARVRWVFAEQEVADVVRSLFADERGLENIEVVHVSPRAP